MKYILRSDHNRDFHRVKNKPTARLKLYLGKGYGTKWLMDKLKNQRTMPLLDLK